MEIEAMSGDEILGDPNRIAVEHGVDKLREVSDAKLVAAMAQT
jgi:hypothetical protein